MGPASNKKKKHIRSSTIKRVSSERYRGSELSPSCLESGWCRMSLTELEGPGYRLVCASSHTAATPFSRALTSGSSVKLLYWIRSGPHQKNWHEKVNSLCSSDLSLTSLRTLVNFDRSTGLPLQNTNCLSLSLLPTPSPTLEKNPEIEYCVPRVVKPTLKI